MSACLKILRAGPSVTVQDAGRPGWLDLGLSRGGAADPMALAEASALLGVTGEITTLEMAGYGGEFEVTHDIGIALTGAPMRATLDGQALSWNASHMMPAGARLFLGATMSGTYGYLSLNAGCAERETLGARSAHLAAGVGGPLVAGDTIALTPGSSCQSGQVLNPEDRFDGGVVRIVESFHSHLFSATERQRFQMTEFRRDRRGNRMGVKLEAGDGKFHAENGRNIVSEVILPGDIQITGDGTPFVLMSECQTTGGYPRIGTVLPCDLPKVAQAMPGTALRFQFVDLDQAVALEREAVVRCKGLGRTVRPLIRDPRTIPDLLSYQLISGVIAGNEE